MTALNSRKTKLRFETSTLYRGRTLIVTASPLYASIREKGRREGSEVMIPWDAVYELGFRIAARLEQTPTKGAKRR